MGIFYDHGVQYMVVTKSRGDIVVVSTKKADNRLVETEYYKKRKDDWFAKGNTFCNRINDGELDIEMEEDEVKKLSSILNSAEDGDVIEHGWYDVQKMYDTYWI